MTFDTGAGASGTKTNKQTSCMFDQNKKYLRQPCTSSEEQLVQFEFEENQSRNFVTSEKLPGLCFI